MAGNSLKQKALSIFEQVKYYWNDPPKGRFIPFREIASYAGGGIGAFFIFNLFSGFLL